ncbi:MAG: DciA family protein [bacterium]
MLIHRKLQSARLEEVLDAVTLPVARRQQSPLVQLRLAWGTICGAMLARHCEPVALEGQRIIIGARGADWRDAVFHQRHALRARIRQVIPAVRELRLVTLDRAAPASPPPRPVEIRPDERTAEVADPGLRAALDRLLATRKASA